MDKVIGGCLIILGLLGILATIWVSPLEFWQQVGSTSLLILCIGVAVGTNNEPTDTKYNGAFGTAPNPPDPPKR